VKTFKTITLGVALISALLIGFGSTAHADFDLELSDGLGDSVIIDATTETVISTTGSAVGAATFLTPGFVTWVGTLGTWNLNDTIALTYPAAGSSNAPVIDIGGTNDSTTKGTLTISASQTGFTNPTSGDVTFSLDINGITGATATELGFASASNADFALTTPLGSVGPATTNTIGTGFLPSTTEPYSLTEEVVIAGTGGKIASTSLDAKMTVPEPVSLLFLGLGLCGAAAYGRYSRRGKKSA
jgi:hypothetical protein